MRLLPHDVAIGILGDRFEEGLVPDPHTAFEGKEDALRFLRELTGEDFGLNVDKWDAWFRDCPDDLLEVPLRRMEPPPIAKAELGRTKTVPPRRGSAG